MVVGSGRANLSICLEFCIFSVAFSGDLPGLVIADHIVGRPRNGRRRSTGLNRIESLSCMRASDSSTIHALPYLDRDIFPNMSSFATCRIQNCYSIEAQVVLLTSQDHAVWEERILLPPGRSVSIDCPTGFLIISVFDPAKDALCMCRASHVSGSFTLLLS